MTFYILMIIGLAVLEGVYLGLQDRFGVNIGEGFRRHKAGME